MKIISSRPLFNQYDLLSSTKIFSDHLVGDFVIGIKGWTHVLVALLAAVDRVLDNGSGGDWGWGDDGDGLLNLLNWLLDNLLLSAFGFPAASPFAIGGASGELLEGDLSLGELLQVPEVNGHDAHQEDGSTTV